MSRPQRRTALTSDQRPSVRDIGADEASTGEELDVEPTIPERASPVAVAPRVRRRGPSTSRHVRSLPDGFEELLARLESQADTMWSQFSFFGAEPLRHAFKVEATERRVDVRVLYLRALLEFAMNEGFAKIDDLRD